MQLLDRELNKNHKRQLNIIRMNFAKFLKFLLINSLINREVHLIYLKMIIFIAYVLLHVIAEALNRL